MSDTRDQIVALVLPVLEPLDVELYDVEVSTGSAAKVLRILLDAPGGVSLDAITDVTYLVSPLLDDADLIRGRYTLEVSSPGLERPLRLPEHFDGALGQRVAVKLFSPLDGQRRLTGELAARHDNTIVLQTEDGEREVALEDVSSARTVFEWKKPAPPKGGRKRRAGSETA
ncbi:MAG: ribosome maturation factor RimP [Actinobacteria bacterium]|nr:ribosome maturation factor RimP [Actinomycetota bacterium]MCB9388120.1 ribosome maturation factor RimP [Acidimicrobiia bacterium]